MFDHEAVLARILETLGQEELERVRSLVGSRTLRDAMVLLVEASQERARLIVPHYWAVYYHDGRGRVSPVSARKLVFFDDPLKNDPRLQGRYPVRGADVRRLTKDEYEDGLRINAERLKAGQPPFMFVVDSVGPSSPHPFFDQLAQGAAGRADATASRVFDEAIDQFVRDDPDVQPESDSVTFGI